MGISNLFKRKKKKIARKETVIAKGVEKLEMKPLEFQKWQSNTKEVKFVELIADEFALSKEYFDLLHRYVPMVSAAVWTWKKICNTKFDIKLVGGSELKRNKAKIILGKLNNRINPIKPVKKGGWNSLLNIYFDFFFKYGRFSGNLDIAKDLSGIKKFDIYNPYNIRFTNDLELVQFVNNVGFKLNPLTSYFYAQNMDVLNPYGTSMLEATPALLKINDDLLRDMANSSSNAGTPRLHFKIDQPELLESEDPEDYASRVNAYFDDTVSALTDVGSDQNFYTWKAMEIGVAGGSVGGTGYVWRVNRQIIDEELITAYHLFPWVLAKSFGTTKNYVQVQFDLLMTEADSIQNEASNFVEWIAKTELLLNGITDVEPEGEFQRLRDPAVKNIAVAESFKIANVFNKVKEGLISPDDGAKELNYQTWHDKNKITNKEQAERPNEKIDESEQRLENEED